MPAPRGGDLIDLVDDHDRVVGAVRRRDVFIDRAGFRTVHVLIFNANGEVLLQRLTPSRKRSPDRWGSSVAGYVHAGEQPVQAARRRMREEIGLSGPLEPCGTSRMEDAGATKFVHVFTSVADHAAENREPDQIAELRFWSLTEVTHLLGSEPDVFTPTFPLVLDRVLGGNAGSG